MEEDGLTLTIEARTVGGSARAIAAEGIRHGSGPPSREAAGAVHARSRPTPIAVLLLFLSGPACGSAATPPPPESRMAAASSSAPAAKASAVDLTVGDLAAVHRAIRARRGAPLLLNVWASWCEPCVDELPDLAKVESRFASSRIKVLGVSSDLILEDDSPALREKVAGALRKAGVGYPNLLYQGDADPLLEAFDLPGPIPYSILYGPDGRVVKRFSGRLRIAELAKTLEALGSPH